MLLEVMNLFAFLLALSIVPQVIHVGLGPVSITSYNNELFVVNYNSSTVTVVQNDQPVTNISVGKGPTIATASKSYVYVANFLSSQVSVIDPSTLKVISNITLPSPYALLYVPQYGEVFATETFSDQVAVIKGTTVVKDISVGGQPTYLAYDPGNSLVYVLVQFPSPQVLAISPANHSVVYSVPLDYLPTTMAYGGGEIYVTSVNSGYLMTIQGDHVSYQKVAVGIFGVAYYNGYLYLTDVENNSVLVYKDGSFVSSIPMGNKPSFIYPFNGKVYVTISGEDYVYFFNAYSPPVNLELPAFIVGVILVVVAVAYVSVRRRL
ncbi:MAG: hypothetical protein ASUL_04174 [Candidatus Aramenus sulfurataquae]|uniref:Uncharacterized protein n=1 Tax=Candidatus Aramenus sulfurataquae TaxID=1326980 RepID=W7KNP9_9CREN|nr:MAG: hypothetical protein ASUL_04174 [Candidatus Aramenus sulfurataquae]